MLNVPDRKHPTVSTADVWTYAGACAVEWTGGPKIPFTFGRTDAPEGSYVPPNGRLPDAAQGAQHLRDVFYRQGFNDQEIVALSGAHTLGRCHLARSGFDGKWTHDPLKFDNSYFTLLLSEEWTPRVWDGPVQYQNATGELMMLPTDVALLSDAPFKAHVERYAADSQAFFDEFSAAFAKLMANGVPENVPAPVSPRTGAKDTVSHEFREAAMHGSHELVLRLAKDADVHSADPASGRTALHKAAFWGHNATVKFLLEECKLNANAQDFDGDTALNDAVHFGHEECAKMLLAAGADKTVKNSNGEDALAKANSQNKPALVAMLS